MNMLIGPTLTLKELEEHMRAKKLENDKKLTKLERELITLRDGLKDVQRLARDEEGNRIQNPEFIKMKDEYEKMREEFENIYNDNEFIKEKIEELEVIEEYSRGEVDKEKDKITLTLKDCMRFGVEVN